MSRKIAKRYVVRGRVQGVGFRAFVEYNARPIGITGWVRNTDDGNVEVYAVGGEEQLSQLENLLWRGPRAAEVHGVNIHDAPVDSALHGFSMRY